MADLEKKDEGKYDVIIENKTLTMNAQLSLKVFRFPHEGFFRACPRNTQFHLVVFEIAKSSKLSYTIKAKNN